MWRLPAIQSIPPVTNTYVSTNPQNLARHPNSSGVVDQLASKAFNPRGVSETDLVRKHSIHRNTMAGNTSGIADNHYLFVSDDDFQKTADRIEQVQLKSKAVQFAVQHDSAGRRIKQYPQGPF